jgi:hypothetical protein
VPLGITALVLAVALPELPLRTWHTDAPVEDDALSLSR